MWPNTKRRPCTPCSRSLWGIHVPVLWLGTSREPIGLSAVSVQHSGDTSPDDRLQSAGEGSAGVMRIGHWRGPGPADRMKTVCARRPRHPVRLAGRPGARPACSGRAVSGPLQGIGVAEPAHLLGTEGFVARTTLVYYRKLPNFPPNSPISLPNRYLVAISEL
jgi:hypothetical protein